MQQLCIASQNGHFDRSMTPTMIGEVLADKSQTIWFDLESPTTADIDLLRNEFSFHELALDDALRGHQRPKIQPYDDYYFLVFYSIELLENEHSGIHIHSHQISLFIGPNYLVSVHNAPIPEVQETLQRWQKNHDVVGHSVGALVYALLDAIVDNYFPVMDRIAEEAEALEEQIFEDFSDEAMETIFTLKKELLTIRRVVSPSRDVLNVLLRRDVPALSVDTTVYFMDVYDHIVRVTDSIDTYRDLLSSALDAYLSMASNRMNQTMRVLTSSSIILMSVTLVAGIYGMNFEMMPELKWSLGYPGALGLMLTIGVVLVLFFRHRGWL